MRICRKFRHWNEKGRFYQQGSKMLALCMRVGREHSLWAPMKKFCNLSPGFLAVVLHVDACSLKYAKPRAKHRDRNEEAGMLLHIAKKDMLVDKPDGSRGYFIEDRGKLNFERRSIL